jgi:hypothetical protein
VPNRIDETNPFKTPIEVLLDAVDWKPLDVPVGIAQPYAIQEGVLEIGGFQFRCYVLNNGQRLLDANDLERFFGE